MAPAYVPFPDFVAWSAGLTVPPFLAHFETLLADLRTTADEESLQRALTRIREFAALQTGAVEDLYEATRAFTYSVAATGAVVDAVANTRGSDIADLVADQLEAYEYVLDAATGSRPITQTWVRQLHAILCRHQTTHRVLTELGGRRVWQDRPLEAGEYKADPNNPTRPDGSVHAYAPPAEVGPEMARLVAQLDDAAFRDAHPVLQAAYAHHAFASIHPFPDGNGRVSRTLASVFTYRRPGVPFLLFVDERDAYLDALEAADAGEVQPLVTFAAERLREAVELVRDSTGGDASPGAALDALQRGLRGASGPSLSQREAGATIERLVRDGLALAIGDLPWDDNIRASVTPDSPLLPIGPTAGYRTVLPSGGQSQLDLTLVRPDHRVRVTLVLEASEGGDAPYDLQVRAVAAPDRGRLAGDIIEPLGVRTDDLGRFVSPRLGVRVKAWTEAVLSRSITLLGAGWID